MAEEIDFTKLKEELKEEQEGEKEYFCSVCNVPLAEKAVYFDMMHDCMCVKCLIEIHKAF